MLDGQYDLDPCLIPGAPFPQLTESKHELSNRRFILFNMVHTRTLVNSFVMFNVTIVGYYHQCMTYLIYHMDPGTCANVILNVLYGYRALFGFVL